MFLAGYCYFMGYAKPNYKPAGLERLEKQIKSGREPSHMRKMFTPEGWYTTELLYDIFNWNL